MDAIEIKSVTPSDIIALQRVGRQTFTEAFSGANSKENMAKYLEEGFSIEKLTEEVSNPNSQFYFAMLDNEAIGYLKLNTGTAQTEIKDGKALEVERIYVLAPYQGKKVGQLLLDKAIKIATDLGSTYVWLGVWENNLNALRFYQKNGFAAFGQHIFKLGEDEQTDIIMQRLVGTD